MAWTLVQRWFGNKGSKGEAKDRLLEVLLLDRFGLTQEKKEALRKDILEVISRYVPIDPERVKIDFQRERAPDEVIFNANAPVRPERRAAEAPKQPAG
jgi:cell division topological specificity factor